MNNDLLDQFVEQRGCQFRDLGVLSYQRDPTLGVSLGFGVFGQFGFERGDLLFKQYPFRLPVAFDRFSRDGLIAVFHHFAPMIPNTEVSQEPHYTRSYN